MTIKESSKHLDTISNIKTSVASDYKGIERLVTGSLKQLGIADLGTPAYLVIASSLVRGQFTPTSAINDTKSVLNYTDTDYPAVFQALKKARLLQGRSGRGNKGKLFISTSFLKDFTPILEHLYETMPAKLFPATEIPEAWTKEKTQIDNIKMISNVSDKVIAAQPDTVRNALNKLQSVAFKPAAQLLPYINKNLCSLTSTSYKKRAELQTLLEYVTRLVDLAPEYYFRCTMDYRGRTYYRGGIMTPQGPDIQKAIWQFATPTAIGENGVNAIALQYANSYGIKGSIAERVYWAEHEGRALAIKIKEEEYFPAEASTPWQTIVAALEWYDLHIHLLMTQSDGSDFLSSLVCHADGSCNGYQHSAALTGHRYTAEFTNCTAGDPTEAPKDIYKEGFAILAKQLEVAPSVHQYLAPVGRSAMKSPVMITGYGAGTAAAVRGMTEACIEHEPRNTETILEVFEEERNAKTIQEAMTQTLAVIAYPLKKTHGLMVKAITKKIENDGRLKSLFWKTADGFCVQHAPRATRNEDKQYQGAGDFTYRIDGINADKLARAITANLTHSQDGCHLRMVVNNAQFDVVTVHDSYGCRPSEYWNMGTIIREQFAFMYSGFDLIASFNQYNGTEVKLPRMGDYQASEVLNSPYFFH